MRRASALLDGQGGVMEPGRVETGGLSEGRGPGEGSREMEGMDGTL